MQRITISKPLCSTCGCKGKEIFLNMQTLAQFITNFIHFFYDRIVKMVPKFGKWMSPELFRYAACGGGNMVLDWVLYFVFYHLLLDTFGNIIYLPFSFFGYLPSAITPHILAFCIVFPITLLTGFWLNKYVTFTQSTVRGRKQLVRYIAIVLVNLLVNYFGLKFFVEICQIYPTPSKMLVTVMTVFISYFGQKYYSFKK